MSKKEREQKKKTAPSMAGEEIKKDELQTVVCIGGRFSCPLTFLQTHFVVERDGERGPRVRERRRIT